MFLKRYSKFFASFGIIFCLLSFVPQNVFAQTPTTQTPGGGRAGQLGNGPREQVQPTQAPGGGRAGKIVSGIVEECSLNPLNFQLIPCLWDALNWLTEVWITLLGWGLGMSGWVLNKTIEITILELNNKVSTPAIAEIWKMIRDLVNIGMIFMVLYIAILTIVQANASATKKMLGGIIFVAIFVNFSLFTTKVLIDASNRVTLVFYNAIVAEGTKSGTDHTGTNDESLGGSIAGVVLNQLNLKTFYRSDASFEENTAGLVIGQTNPQTNPGTTAPTSPGSMAIGLIGGSIFIVIAIYTFLAISVMLIVRFATLILLLVFSPAGFLLGITSGLNNNWWKELWKNLLFPPAMFLMLWVSIYCLNVLTKETTSATGGGWFNAITSLSYSTSDLFVKFFLAIVLLLASMIIANKIGSTGAAQLQSWVNKSSKSVLGGMAGFAGRNTFGRAGRWAGNVYDNQVGNRLYGSRESLKNFSQDKSKNGLLRFGAGALGGVVGGINTTSTRTVRRGLEMVEGGKYGSARSLKEEEDLLRKEMFAQRGVNERKENENDIRRNIKLEEKLGQQEFTLSDVRGAMFKTTLGEITAIEAAHKKDQAGEDLTKEEKARLDAFERKVGNVGDKLEAIAGDRADANSDFYNGKNDEFKIKGRDGSLVSMADITKKFSKLGDKDIELMLQENSSLATDPKFLRLLTPDQVKGLTKREGVSAGEASEIKNKYKSEMKRAIDMGMLDRIDGMGVGELAGGLAPDVLLKFLDSAVSVGTSKFTTESLHSKISTRTLDAISRNEDFSDTDRESVDIQMGKLIRSVRDNIEGSGIEGDPFKIKSSLTGKDKENSLKVLGIMNWYKAQEKQGNVSKHVTLT